MFDTNEQKKRFDAFIIVSICQEESIKILSLFFKHDSDFWEVWNARRFEYINAFKIDKTLKDVEDFSDFEKLADCKSAFAKAYPQPSPMGVSFGEKFL